MHGGRFRRNGARSHALLLATCALLSALGAAAEVADPPGELESVTLLEGRFSFGRSLEPTGMPERAEPLDFDPPWQLRARLFGRWQALAEFRTGDFLAPNPSFGLGLGLRYEF